MHLLFCSELTLYSSFLRLLIPEEPVTSFSVLREPLLKFMGLSVKTLYIGGLGTNLQHSLNGHKCHVASSAKWQ